MNQTVLDNITEIRKTIYGNHNFIKYQHSMSISGYLLTKPTIEKLEKYENKEVARFVLIQIKNVGYECYPLQTFSKPIIEKLKQIDNGCLVVALGRLIWNIKTTKYFLQVEELEIVNTFGNMPLEIEYDKEKRQWKQTKQN